MTMTSVAISLILFLISLLICQYTYFKRNYSKRKNTIYIRNAKELREQRQARGRARKLT